MPIHSSIVNNFFGVTKIRLDYVQSCRCFALVSIAIEQINYQLINCLIECNTSNIIIKDLLLSELFHFEVINYVVFLRFYRRFSLVYVTLLVGGKRNGSTFAISVVLNIQRIRIGAHSAHIPSTHNVYSIAENQNNFIFIASL